MSLYPTMEPTLVQSYARTLGPNREQAHVVRSDLGSDAQLLGAAEVGFADVLEDPAGTLEARREQLDPTRRELGEVHQIRADGQLTSRTLGAYRPRRPVLTGNGRRVTTG